MTQLDRIESKLDKLLRMFGTESTSDMDAKAAVYASGGVADLKSFMKSESDRKAKGVCK
jgi:hypothetical protein